MGGTCYLDENGASMPAMHTMEGRIKANNEQVALENDEYSVLIQSGEDDLEIESQVMWAMGEFQRQDLYIHQERARLAAELGISTM